jgi:hypothetical protein
MVCKENLGEPRRTEFALKALNIEDLGAWENLREEYMVPRRGLEPPHPYEY